MIKFTVEFIFKKEEDEKCFCRGLKEYRCEEIRTALLSWFQGVGKLGLWDEIAVNLVSGNEELRVK